MGAVAAFYQDRINAMKSALTGFLGVAIGGSVLMGAVLGMGVLLIASGVLGK